MFYLISHPPKLNLRPVAGPPPAPAPFRPGPPAPPIPISFRTSLLSPVFIFPHFNIPACPLPLSKAVKARRTFCHFAICLAGARIRAREAEYGALNCLSLGLVVLESISSFLRQRYRAENGEGAAYPPMWILRF